MKNINIAVIGLGGRGISNLNTILSMEDITVTAVCDIYEDRCQKAVDIVKEKAGNVPFSTTDYREIMGKPEVEAVMVFTSWESHIEIAVEAMKHSHAVGMEVGGAGSLEECWALVNTWEETRVPFMLLENCCYGKNEMLVKNIVEDGLFGDIVHCHGAYAHDLRDEVSGGKENRHYRLNHYINRNCENYPTHDLGPIAKILKINHGNCFKRLVSVASKSMGLNRYINDRKDTVVNKDLLTQTFAQGDIINTIITCANGETISLTLDTTLPRSYSREFTVRGTKGMYEENTNTVFLDGEKESFDTVEFYRENIDSAKKYEEKYLPDCWKNLTQEQIESGHGGMDYFVFTDFFEHLRNGKPMPIDVYDAAAWMCVTCLSEESIKNGNMPVEFPDFTKGEWGRS